MFTKWVEAWNEVLNKVREQGGDIQELELEPPASPEELHDMEKELGVRIPASLRELLGKHTGKLYFRWVLPDEAILPEEFKEIFSGELGWSLEELEYWQEDSAVASGCEGLAGMLVFAQAGNGDMLALDMNQEAAGEPPVVYWEHETDEVRLIAPSFQEYVKRMTELSCIGSELWQYEAFLGPDGLDTNSEQAQQWKDWFATFQSLQFEEASRTLDSLFTYIKYHGAVRARETEALQRFPAADIFRLVRQQLPESNPDERIVLSRIVGETLGNYADAAQWVRGLWEEQEPLLTAEIRSYLTARCLPLAEGCRRVMTFLEQETDGKMSGYDAFEHLAPFQHRSIIEWMGQHSRLPAAEGWSRLYAYSRPDWADVKQWAGGDTRQRLTLLQALDDMLREQHHDTISSQRLSTLKPVKVCGVPSREAFIQFLEKLYEEEPLRTKKALLRQIIEHVDEIMERELPEPE